MLDLLYLIPKKNFYHQGKISLQKHLHFVCNGSLITQPSQKFMVQKNIDNYYTVLLFIYKIYNHFVSFNYTCIK